MMLLYHYSSLEKCIFIFLAIAAVYAFNQGWFGLRGEPNGREVPQPQRDPTPEENNPQEDQEQHENQQEEGALGEEPSAWEVFWSTCYIFITSFFASMIPERAPAVDN